jgi:penicillin-binding protein 1A
LPTRRSVELQKRRGKSSSAIGSFIKYTFVAVVIAGAIAVGYAGAKLWSYLGDLPDLSLVERYEPIEAIQLFDRNDHLICTVEGDQDRRVMPLNQISSQMQQAMLAAEDHHFYEHHGVNFSSIGRASIANLQKGHVVEGGSTITQQLVKNLFFTDAQRTFDRKVKEALMAWEVERRYTKEKILEMYLNQVFFGNNAYGIERAASRYFDRTAAELDLAQSAFLAGLVKAPSELGLATNRSKAIERQQDIIDKMVEYGYITQSQADAAKTEKLKFKKGVNPLQKYPYYVSAVLETLRSHFSQTELRKQGLRVFTNLDPQAQDAAEKVLTEDLKKTPKGVSQAALVTVSVQDGAVLALVGGVGNFWTHQFNRATNPHTAGSSFKPFVYLTSFLQGKMTPDSMIEDTPLVIKQPYGLKDYAPQNFDHKFYGKITVRRALALSRNVCSVRIAQLVGVDSIVETARQAGITTKLEPNLSLALGSSAVTPLDMAGAYATFPRMGIAIKPQLLRTIQNNRGQVIEIFDPKRDRVFPIEPVARLVDVMQDVVKYGTGTMAKLDDRPVAGKTGTADAAKDIWFVGYTTDMCTAVWGGNDENKPIEGKHVTGGDVMAKIWKDYAKQYYEVHPTPGGVFFAPTQPTKDESDRNQKKKDDGDLAKDAKSGASPAVPDEPKVVKVPVANGVVELRGQAPQEDKPKTVEDSKTESQLDGSGSHANPLLPQTAPPASLPSPIYAPAPSSHAHAAVQNPSVMMRMPPGSESSEGTATSEPAVGLRAKAGMQSLGAPNRLYPANPTSPFRPANQNTTAPVAEPSQ